MYYPKKLEKGATIGLIQPAGAISQAKFEIAKTNIANLGFRVVHQPELPRKLGYLGGTDDERSAELHAMFQNPEVDAIWCVRGGYGTQRYIHKLDFELIRNHPKPFVGFSDITALLNSITNETGMITYHGIMGVSEFSSFDIAMFEKVVMQQDFPTTIKPLNKNIAASAPAFHPYTLNEGIAIGELIGGNLALLAAAVGTPFDVDYDGKILFIEEIAEAPYRIDRMFTQLLQAGKLDKVAGVALGIFKGCQPEENEWKSENSLSLRQVIEDRLCNLNVPVVYGLPFGHIPENATLPVGGLAKLDATRIELELLPPLRQETENTFED